MAKILRKKVQPSLADKVKTVKNRTSSLGKSIVSARIPKYMQITRRGN